MPGPLGNNRAAIPAYQRWIELGPKNSPNPSPRTTPAT